MPLWVLKPESVTSLLSKTWRLSALSSNPNVSQPQGARYPCSWHAVRALSPPWSRLLLVQVPAVPGIGRESLFSTKCSKTACAGKAPHDRCESQNLLPWMLRFGTCPIVTLRFWALGKDSGHRSCESVRKFSSARRCSSNRSQCLEVTPAAASLLKLGVAWSHQVSARSQVPSMFTCRGRPELESVFHAVYTKR